MHAPRHRIVLFALASLSVFSARAARAGDAPPAAPSAATSDHERMIAALLESADVRMKAKLEEAAVLDRLGRHDEALATLRTIEVIHRETMAWIGRLAPAAPARVKADGSVGRVVPAGRGVRVRIEPLAPTPLPLGVDTAQAQRVAAAGVTWLLGAQRIDGWFRPGAVSDAVPGADLDEGHDLHATSMAILAIVESLDDDLNPPRARDAALRGVAALLTTQNEAGAFGDGKDLEAHALATWAVASAASRFPHAPWRPAAPAALGKAVSFSLAARDARGLWSAGTGSPDDDWVLSAWMATGLHEIEALPKAFLRDVDLGVVLDRVGEAAREAAARLLADEATPRPSPAGGFARALLTGQEPVPPSLGRDSRAKSELPTTADEEVAILLGTTLNFHRCALFAPWDDDVLATSARMQRREGELSGSWDPADARSKFHGRTFATACRVLAALVPVVPYRDASDD